MNSIDHAVSCPRCRRGERCLYADPGDPNKLVRRPGPRWIPWTIALLIGFFFLVEATHPNPSRPRPTTDSPAAHFNWRGADCIMTTATGSEVVDNAFCR